MARKPNFTSQENTYEYKVLLALQNGTASKSEVEEVATDIQKHLNTSIGTLENYCGRFGLAAVKALQENYHIFQPNEEIVSAKLNRMMNVLYEKVVSNEQTNVNPTIVKIIFDYLKGQADNQQTSQPINISVGYPVVDYGQMTLPVEKED